jgi:hypothetical protein
MNPETRLVEFVSRELLERHWAACCVFVLLVVIWRLWLRTIYLGELLRREQQSVSGKLEGLQARLLEVFFREPRPTLSELVNDTAHDFSLKP